MYFERWLLNVCDSSDVFQLAKRTAELHLLENEYDQLRTKDKSQLKKKDRRR